MTAPQVPDFIRASWSRADAEQQSAEALDAILERPDVVRVAVLHDGHSSTLSGLDRSGRQVYTFDAKLARSELHAQLAAQAGYDLIVLDALADEDRGRLFQSVFLHLRPGGSFFVRTFLEVDRDPAVRSREAQLSPFLGRVTAMRGTDPAELKLESRRNEARLAEAVGLVQIGDDHLVVENRIASHAKMRESEIKTVIGVRGDDFGAVLSTKPSSEFDSRCRLWQNRAPRKPDLATFTVPEMSIRLYRDAVCSQAGIVLRDTMVLPESFRHHLAPRLGHTRAPSRNHLFMDIPDPVPNRRISGPVLYLDSEYPGHFGHFMSEVVSRLWAWEPARELYPGLKALLSVPRNARGPASWAKAVLAAAGIEESDIELIDTNEVVAVNQLIGNTPMFSMPEYVDPDIAGTWRRIGDHLPRTGDQTYPARIFIERPPGAVRPCDNEDAVVARFREAGFEPVRPEKLPLGEQVAMFRQAEVIAGFAGSAMLNLLYCTSPKHAIILNPLAYISSNEYLISSVHGHRLDQLISKSRVNHPDNGWSWDAFYASWTFDFDDEGQELERLLLELDGRSPAAEPEPVPAEGAAPPPVSTRVRKAIAWRLQRLGKKIAP